MEKLKKVLVTAYALNPYKGSEDGTGWNLLMQVARKYNVHVFTRKNNAPAIQQFMQESDDPRLLNLNFHYYDLPPWAMWWKKGKRLATLYFYLWQIGVSLRAFQLGLDFELAHALNFHSDSHPQFLWLHGKPVIWGPVGHHPPIPKDFVIKEDGKRAYYADRTRYLTKVAFRRLDPFYRIACWTAKKVLVVNPTVPSAMLIKESKAIHFPAVGAKIPSLDYFSENSSGKFTVLSAGRLVAMKGFETAIKSFAEFVRQLKEDEREGVEFIIMGSGPQEKRLKKIAAEQGVETLVHFTGWISHEEALNNFKNSQVFLFCSHEGAGMVVPEALSYAVPVICFDNAGPGTLVDKDCSFVVSDKDYDACPELFAQHLLKLYRDPNLLESYSLAARSCFLRRFDWEAKGDRLLQMYSEILGKARYSSIPNELQNKRA